MDPFQSYQDVEDWVRENGVQRLRAMLAREQMRPRSQFWGCAWLARHEEERRRELELARRDLARTVAAAPLV